MEGHRTDHGECRLSRFEAGWNAGGKRLGDAHDFRMGRNSLTAARDDFTHAELGNARADRDHLAGGAVAQRDGRIQTVGHLLESFHHSVRTDLVENSTDEIRPRQRLRQQILPREFRNHPLGPRAHSGAKVLDQNRSRTESRRGDLDDFEQPRPVVLDHLSHATARPVSSGGWRNKVILASRPAERSSGRTLAGRRRLGRAFLQDTEEADSQVLAEPRASFEKGMKTDEQAVQEGR